MRHNPASGAIVIMLRSLKMHGMAQAISELTEQGAPAFETAVPILSQLLKAEMAEREVRSTAYQLKAARFPAYRDLNGFDFASSEINEALVRQLHRCEFLQDAHNVVLVGGPGTGKTHVATALGVQVIEHHHKRVRFFSTVELVNALEQEKAQGKAGQIACRLAYADLVILDELGYLPSLAAGRHARRAGLRDCGSAQHGGQLLVLVRRLSERIRLPGGIRSSLTATRWRRRSGSARPHRFGRAQMESEDIILIGTEQDRVVINSSALRRAPANRFGSMPNSIFQRESTASVASDGGPSGRNGRNVSN